MMNSKQSIFKRMIRLNALNILEIIPQFHREQKLIQGLTENNQVINVLDFKG